VRTNSTVGLLALSNTQRANQAVCDFQRVLVLVGTSSIYSAPQNVPLLPKLFAFSEVSSRPLNYAPILQRALRLIPPPNASTAPSYCKPFNWHFSSTVMFYQYASTSILYQRLFNFCGQQAEWAGWHGSDSRQNQELPSLPSLPNRLSSPSFYNRKEGTKSPGWETNHSPRE